MSGESSASASSVIVPVNSAAPVVAVISSAAPTSQERSLRARDRAQAERGRRRLNRPVDRVAAVADRDRGEHAIELDLGAVEPNRADPDGRAWSRLEDATEEPRPRARAPRSRAALPQIVPAQYARDRARGALGIGRPVKVDGNARRARDRGAAAGRRHRAASQRPESGQGRRRRVGGAGDVNPRNVRKVNRGNVNPAERANQRLDGRGHVVNRAGDGVKGRARRRADRVEMVDQDNEADADRPEGKRRGPPVVDDPAKCRACAARSSAENPATESARARLDVGERRVHDRPESRGVFVERPGSRRARPAPRSRA